MSASPSLPQIAPVELGELVAQERLAEEHDHLVIVDLLGEGPMPDGLGSAACVVIGLGPADAPAAAAADVVAEGESTAAALVEAVRRAPEASTALVVLLRMTERLDPALGLAAESAVYSTLQGGPTFTAWRAGREPAAPDPRDLGHDPVHAERMDDELRVTLDRPWKHNALNAGMRDALTEVLGVALADESIRRVVLAGRGPSFSSGGDLDEFGTFPDPATAHQTRLTRSPARALWSLAERLEVHTHGAALGAGVELAAIGHHVIAAPDARFGLPELRLGLVPGAGGTVSLPRRIGRQRTARLALTGETIDAETARHWGLVDEIRASGPELGDPA